MHWTLSSVVFQLNVVTAKRSLLSPRHYRFLLPSPRYYRNIFPIPMVITVVLPFSPLLPCRHLPLIHWRTYTGCGCHNVSSTSCVCWCTAWMEQHRDTCRTWQCLSAAPHVVSYAQRRPLIWLYHQHVGHQSRTVRMPLQVHERGTVYRQPSAQPPSRSLPSKKNLNRFSLDSSSGRDNVNNDYVKRSSNSLYRIIG